MPNRRTTMKPSRSGSHQPRSASPTVPQRSRARTRRGSGWRRASSRRCPAGRVSRGRAAPHAVRRAAGSGQGRTDSRRANRIARQRATAIDPPCSASRAPTRTRRGGRTISPPDGGEDQPACLCASEVHRWTVCDIAREDATQACDRRIGQFSSANSGRAARRHRTRTRRKERHDDAGDEPGGHADGEAVETGRWHSQHPRGPAQRRCRHPDERAGDVASQHEPLRQSDPGADDRKRPGRASSRPARSTRRSHRATARGWRRPARPSRPPTPRSRSARSAGDRAGATTASRR